MLRKESNLLVSIDFRKMVEEILRIGDRNTILQDGKRAAEYSCSLDGQTIIHSMAGEL
jgi:ABC-type sugar transport system ATPase subunit